ncbi:DUF2530 domain-containing protein [Spongisporangium articulatum]|uniref:DUF2530 domain-containing protein n=1 Tax=Spongisporangium articulatum TaxID=3362603 RepID=A0ABW8AH04_9ACTN
MTSTPSDPRGEAPLPGVKTAPVDGSLPYSAQRPPVAVGTLIWLVLLVVTFLDRENLRHDGHGWWVWTCLAGVVLGVVGFAMVHNMTRDDRA